MDAPSKDDFIPTTNPVIAARNLAYQAGQKVAELKAILAYYEHTTPPSALYRRLLRQKLHYAEEDLAMYARIVRHMHSPAGEEKELPSRKCTACGVVVTPPYVITCTKGKCNFVDVEETEEN